MSRKQKYRRDWYLKLTLVFVTFLFLTLLVLPRATAVVIRHDKTDADALRLGERFIAVGRVLPGGGCTLIAPTWIVTAAHVAASLPSDGKIQFGDSLYKIKRTILHPEGIGPKGQPPEVDLALIELAEPVKHITPIELYRGRKEVGKTLVIVGYGNYGNPLTGIHHTDGKRRAVTNIVSDAGPRRIFMKFEKPPKGSEYEGVGGPGDSGGSALLQEGEKFFLVGVSSASMDGKPGQYGVTDVYTRISSYVQWLEKTVKIK